jgi:SAM-dependent methyltransferase
MAGQKPPNPFPKFPKRRPPLPPAYRHLYAREYEVNREGKTLANRAAIWLETWMHRKIAERPDARKSSKVLELGAGTLNHLPFETFPLEYDIVEPQAFLYQRRPELKKVSRIFKGLDQVPAQSAYDRIFSIAVLEHVTDLPQLVATSARALKPGGRFQAGFPSEGGFLWGFAWRCTTGVSFRLRHHLDYSILMRHEHVNSAPEILEVVQFFFERVRISRFPLPFHHLSFYACLEAAEPRMDRVTRFLKDERARDRTAA